MEQHDRDEWIRTAARYSKTNGELLTRLMDSPALRQRTWSSDTLSPFMQNYEFGVNPWPVIISRGIVDAFTRYVQSFPDLLFKLVDLCFRDDPAKFESWLGVPAITLELFRHKGVDTKSLLARHDTVFCGGDIKVVEVNAGSGIGGGQHDWLCRTVSESLALIGPEAARCEYRSIVSRMLATIVKTATRNDPGKSRVNTAVFRYYFDRDHEKEWVDDIGNIYRDVVEKLGLEGKFFSFSNFDAFTFSASGEVFYESQPIDCILLSLPEHMTVPSYHRMRFIASWVAGKLVMPDNPVSTLYGNKNLLALAHDQRVQQQLGDEERQTIEKYIPWACRLTDADVTFRGETRNAIALARERKNELVVKKAVSAQGRDVFVGKFCSEDRWAALIPQLAQEGKCLLQEYCPPDQMLACTADGELAAFDAVWGIFEFENAYGGSFMRGSLANQGDGVINSAKGALEFLVFEEIARKAKILL